MRLKKKRKTRKFKKKNHVIITVLLPDLKEIVYKDTDVN